MKNILIYPDRRTFKILTEPEIQTAIEEWCLSNPQRTGKEMFSVTPFFADPGEGVCGDPKIILI